MYSTGRATLAKHSTSMLATMFSDRQAGSLIKDKGGTVFIDRDGHLFGHILEWLRTGHVRLCDAEEREMLRLEADYFMLDELSHKLKNMIYREKISNNDFWKMSQLSILYADGGQKNSHFVLTYADLRYVAGFRCLLTKTSLIKNCTQFVFTGCDLRGINLSNIDVASSGATLDFDHSILAKAVFEKSVLKASFKCANLVECNFQDTKFIGSSCFNQADLREANFSNSNIKSVSFTNCILKGATFNGATLDGSNFFKADMTEASLVRTQLKSVCLDYAELVGANMAEANLTTATLKHANLSRANFRGASLAKANLSHSNCHGTDFHEADKKAAIYEGTVFF